MQLMKPWRLPGRRGSVVQVSGKRDCAFDFIIIEADRNVFVKVKRSQTSFTYPLEILNCYQREIASLHRVALTSVTAREFWVRSPDGTWQFFLVRHDSVLDIQVDGLYIPRESLPVVTVDLSGTPANGTSVDATDDPVSPSENRE
jgi:hypothetical protein